MADCTAPIQVEPAPACTSDLDCPQGTECRNGTCEPVTQPEPGLTPAQGVLLVGAVGAGLWWYRRRA